MARIEFPKMTEMPTNGVDQLKRGDRGAVTVEKALELARTLEQKYEALKLHHDRHLDEVTYAPLLAAHDDVTDDELKQMVVEAGWTVDFDQFGTPAELAMWLNRFRRFRAVVLGSEK